MPLSRFEPDRYHDLLDTKIHRLMPRFLALRAPDPEIHTSPTAAFRLRAEFRLWHEGDNLDYVMFKPEDRKTPVVIDRFPIASEAIQQLMPRLLEELKASAVLRRKIFQVEFLSTLSGDMLVTLIYHRALADDWQQAAAQLAQSLGIKLIGRSRKQKIVLSDDWVDECLHINGQTFHLRQPEQAFTQPNGKVNEAMIAWAIDATQPLDHDLLELYCGIGNFTLPLAGQFNNVIATELSKVATSAAEHNRIANHIDNIEFARLSAEDMSAALAGERPFRRLAHLAKPLAEYQLNTLLVDPPRAGLDDKTLALAATFPTILYISCNPNTLLANIEALQGSHQVERLAFFDQFPYTDHLECGVLLRRNNEN